MTPDEVRAARRKIDDELAEADMVRNIALAKLTNLTRRCPHTNAKQVSHQSDTCFHCFDCGSCDV